MKVAAVRACAILALTLSQASGSASAQGRLEDYQRAEQFLPWNARKLVFNVELTPHWIGDTERFWYRRESPQGATFMLVDARSGAQAPAFDHEKLAAALSRASGSVYGASRLPFSTFQFTTGDSRALRVIVGDATWQCELASYECRSVTAATVAVAGELRSPDGQWSVLTRGGNLHLRQTVTGSEHALTDDAQPDYDYAGRPESTVTPDLIGAAKAPLALFSPDSRRLLTYRLDRRQVGRLPLIQTMPGARPVPHSYRMALPGDPQVPQAELALFDVHSRQAQPLDTPRLPVLFRSPFESGARYRKVWWNETGTHFYFVEEERGYKAARLHVVDARTGRSRQLLEERTDTYLNIDLSVTVVGDGSEILWSSERDGWNHLYRVDGVNGGIRNRITSGAWIVRSVQRVDRKGGWIYFIGSGREPGRDPYFRHLYRVRFDGSGLQLLTPENADHSVSFSPSGRYFTDTYSTVAAAPVSVLRSSHGRLVKSLLTADLGPLLATGWRFPEPFQVKAQDGVTDVYGVIIRPATFDPARRYPVIDDVYPGPQHSKVFKSFSVEPPSALWAQSTAELGFIVVLIDGKGTPYRSRAFRETSYGNLGDAGGLEDHIAALKQLAQRHPYMDLSRVGIYGNSGGGYATARALLKYPDFYKVGVAAAGNHDPRTYHAAWGERWQGYPADAAGYRAQANVTLAANLKGKLLLVHGDMDDNVNVGDTLQLVDALIDANKDFDLLILPNREHVFGNVSRPQPLPWRFAYADRYFLRKRWDYFVTHLLGVAPPPYRIGSGEIE